MSPMIGPATGIQSTSAKLRQFPEHASVLSPFLLRRRVQLTTPAIPQLTPNVTAPAMAHPRRVRCTISYGADAGGRSVTTNAGRVAGTGPGGSGTVGAVPDRRSPIAWASGTG